MFANTPSSSASHRVKKLDRWREKVITTVTLDKWLIAGRRVLSLAISETRGQNQMLGLLRPLNNLSHDTILSWIVATSVLVLVIGEGIQVNPALEKESVSRYEFLK